jgi:peptide/nickel transport system permease protein
MVPAPYRSAPGPLAAVFRRILQGLLTAWAAVSFTFFALRVAGGDPIANLLAQGLATAEQATSLRHALGLDRPLLTQYLHFLGGLIRGDLGASLYTSRAVSTIIGEQVPPTAALASAGLLVALAVGFILGVTAAWSRRPLIGGAAGILSSLALTLPVAVTGVLSILALGLAFRAIPGANLLNDLERLALPAVVLGFASCGGIARLVQAGLAESLERPYILAAKARGLPVGGRLLWHALRPTLPPVVSLTALEASFLFAGTVVTETVFSRPGLGRLLVSSILRGDFPVAQGIVVLAALLYTGGHILADLLALAIDPRLRRQA